MIENLDKQWLLKINNCLLIVPNCANLCFLMANWFDSIFIKLNINELVTKVIQKYKNMKQFIFFITFSQLYTKRSSKNLKVESLSKFFDSDKIKVFQL